MTITTETIAALAPDQASLAAASKLTKPGKWPLRAQDAESGLVWGECQGSGANPYRTVFELVDHGYKCSCPSRKFPCKHVLALMWMRAEEPAAFTAAPLPDWVEDWRGRKRKGGAATTETPPAAAGKSLAAARAAAEAPPAAAPDPAAERRAQAAAEKRAGETRAALLGAMADLETWIADQLRGGLGGLLGEPARCRAIAARMVDGKAQTLAGRLDELPATLLALSGEDRLDALIAELGRLVILARAFRATPDDPALRRAVVSAEPREALLADPAAPRVTALWQVAGERIRTRRDGLVSQASWLMNLTPAPGAPRFAQLLDFFPASAGRRGSAFAPGERFEAELAFYPGPVPLRAVIVARNAAPPPLQTDWPEAPAEPLLAAAELFAAAPWEPVAPLLLPPGRVMLCAQGRPWWGDAQGALVLPLAQRPAEPLLGIALERAAALWDGVRLSLLSAPTGWGLAVADG